MTQSIQRTTKIYSLLNFLYWLTNALPLALLILLLQSRGLTLIQVSVLFGLNALAVVLLEVPTGSLADIVGRKQVTVWAAVLMLLGFTVFLIAFSFPTLLLGSVIYGISRALASGALDAWFVDEVQRIDPDVELQPLFAQAGIATLLGLAVGTLAGGALPLLLPNLPADDSAILTQYSLPLAASIVVQLIRLGLVVFLVYEERPRSTRSLMQLFQTMPSFISQAAQMSRNSSLIRWLLLTTFAGGFVMVGLENFWQPHFATLLADGGEINTLPFGIIMAGNFILGAVGNMISTPLAKRFGHHLGWMVGCVALLRGTALLFLIVQGNLYLATLFFWSVYFGMGLSDPANGVMLHSELSAEHRSTMLSIQSMVSYIGVFMGSLLLGLIAEYVSIQFAWGVAAGVLMLLLLPYRKIDQLYSAKQLPKNPNDQDTQLQTI